MSGILTINQAGYLADLMRGVEQGKLLRWYPLGTDSAENPLTVVLRAFTSPDGTLYPHDSDIRDAWVRASGRFERWFPVRDVLAALANMTNCTDETKPLASIDG